MPQPVLRGNFAQIKICQKTEMPFFFSNLEWSYLFLTFFYTSKIGRARAVTLFLVNTIRWVFPIQAGPPSSIKFGVFMLSVQSGWAGLLDHPRESNIQPLKASWQYCSSNFSVYIDAFLKFWSPLPRWLDWLDGPYCSTFWQNTFFWKIKSICHLRPPIGSILHHNLPIRHHFLKNKIFESLCPCILPISLVYSLYPLYPP